MAAPFRFRKPTGGSTVRGGDILRFAAGGTTPVSNTAGVVLDALAGVKATAVAQVESLAAAAPANTGLPVITGTPQVAQILSSSTGSWSGSPTSFGYQWERCDATGGSCSAIPAATASTYTVTNSDVGATLRVQVTASSSAGFATATSSATAVVTYPPPPPPIPTATVTRLPWRYVLSTLNGESLGEARAYSRALSVGISRGATASFRIRADDPLWQETVAGETMLKVYNSTGTLVFYGPVVSDEETGSGQGASVQVTATDMSWRLDHRIVGADPTGKGTVFKDTDSGQIIVALLGTLNAAAPTGIVVGTTGAFVKRTVTYLWRKMLDVLTELGSIQGSYEWQLRYIDGTPPMVYLDLVTAVGGDQTQTVYFEYGTGLNNCSSYGRVRATDVMANRVWVLGSGSTSATLAFDQASMDSYGYVEDVVTYGDITSIALLDALGAANVQIRKQPRVLLSMTPFPKTAPRYAADWDIGDFVTSRVVAQGTSRVDGTARIWGADISIDESGNETATLQLVPQ